MYKHLKQIVVIIILVVILILPYFVFADETNRPNSSAKGHLSVFANPNYPVTEDQGVPAPTLKENLEALGGAAGYEKATETTLSEIIGTVVSAFLSLLGIIFIVLVILAGHNWMTASGNEEKLTKAKESLWRATIGLIIVVGAFAIWTFVFSKLFK